MSKELQTRDEIDDKYKWNLNDIYADNQSFESELERVLKEVKNISKLKDDFTDSPDNLLAALNKIIKIEEQTSKLYAYAHMKYDQNTQNEKYQNYKNKAMMCYNKLSNSTSFMVPAIIQLGEAKLNEFKEVEPELEFYNHFFDDILRQKDHYLSAAEEKILALAGEVTQSSENIFSMLNNADLEFPLIKDENDEEIRLTHGRYIDLLKNEDRRVRQDAFEGMHGEYQNLENTFAAVLDSSIKGDVFYARARKYDSALESALDSDNISTDVYNNLINTVSNNLEPLHQYMELKKEPVSYTHLTLPTIYSV